MNTSSLISSYNYNLQCRKGINFTYKIFKDKNIVKQHSTQSDV